MSQQPVWVSVVVYDSSDLRISISTSEDAIRRDLIEFYNDNMDDSDQDLDPDTSVDEVREAILTELGGAVTVEENCVWTPEPRAEAA